MSTGWPLEARQALLMDCWNAIKDSDAIESADGARSDWYWLTKAILEDTEFETTTRARLTAALKKTPLWDKVRVFMISSSNRCAACSHGGYNHGGYGKNSGTKACDHRSYHYDGHNHTRGPQCTCKKFVRAVVK